MISTLKRWLGYVVAIVVILIIWLLLTWFLPIGDKREYVINVVKGDGPVAVAQKLTQAGLKVNPSVFSFLIKTKKAEQKIKIGKYSFFGPLSMTQIADQLVGSQSTEQRITVIEGWSAKQIGEYLEKQGLVRADDFWEYVNNPPTELYDEYKFLQLGKGLEGFLFPDTYQVYKNSSVADLVKIFLDNFERKVGTAINNQWPRDFYSHLILASIVQDEVGADKDMANVADVFIKRLQKNIPLQSDATVNYITGKGMASPLISDTKIDNLYNTYRYPGLTPGPISNPGVLAIQSVLKPISNPYYYFLTTKTGEVIYSKTFEEHVANKNKYLR